MDFKVVYWHWLLLGLLLITAELFVPSFAIIWFGLAAIGVSLLMLLLPTLTPAWQLLIWAAGSCAMTYFWFKFVKPRMVDRTQAGIAREALLGQTGQVIKMPVAGRNGVVRFTVPILGDDEWPFFCDQPVTAGDRVVVKEISGNTLVVKKHEPK